MQEVKEKIFEIFFSKFFFQRRVGGINTASPPLVFGSWDGPLP